MSWKGRSLTKLYQNLSHARLPFRMFRASRKAVVCRSWLALKSEPVHHLCKQIDGLNHEKASHLSLLGPFASLLLAFRVCGTEGN
jgi:hypothetical protein